MRLSIVMAAHNEGELLAKTVESCQEVCTSLEYEIVVADDGTTDGSVTELRKRFPEVRVCGHADRLGPSPAKDSAARSSTGDTLLFLDSHCKPEPGAIDLLVAAVEQSEGRSIVVPATASLDVASWTNSGEKIGYGYQVDLLDFRWKWLQPKDLTRCGPYYETPSLIGCCLAISRSLYKRLGGFDRDMLQWGVEDVELGVKSWFLGHSVWCEPKAIVGHRFQKGFEHYDVPDAHIVANRLRMACKVFGTKTWSMWLDRFRASHPSDLWSDAWAIFARHRSSAEVERSYLQQRRVHDEFSYAARFNLSWPRRGG